MLYGSKDKPFKDEYVYETVDGKEFNVFVEGYLYTDQDDGRDYKEFIELQIIGEDGLPVQDRNLKNEITDDAYNRDYYTD